jgi:hypothetical protein
MSVLRETFEIDYVDALTVTLTQPNCIVQRPLAFLNSAQNSENFLYFLFCRIELGGRIEPRAKSYLLKQPEKFSEF